MRMRGYEESGLECKITSDSCAKNYVVPFYWENLEKLVFNTSFAILTTSSVTNLHVGGRTHDLSQYKRTRCLWFFSYGLSFYIINVCLIYVILIV